MALPLFQSREPWLLRAIDAATQVLNIIGSLLILMLMVVIGLDVARRNLMGLPVPGVPEIVTLSIVAIVFLQVPQALKDGRLTRTETLEFFLEANHPRSLRLVRSLFDLIGIAVVAVIVSMTVPLLVDAWRTDDYIGSIGSFTAPTWPVKAAIVVGGAFMILQFVAGIVRRHRPTT